MTAKGYKIICVSLYDDDLVKLDAKVAELKARGHRRANRSLLFRLALAHFTVDEIDAQLTRGRRGASSTPPGPRPAPP